MKKKYHRVAMLLTALVMVVSCGRNEIYASDAYTTIHGIAPEEAAPFSAEQIARIQEHNDRIDNSYAIPYTTDYIVQNSLAVTPVRQINGYYCGPATAVMAAQALGLGVYTQADMASIIGTTVEGSSSPNICNGLNYLLSNANDDRTYEVTTTAYSSIQNSIRNSIDNGAPVIVSVSRMPSYTVSGHFIIITGYRYEYPGVSVAQVRSIPNLTVTYIDPHYNTAYFGEHTMTLDQLVTACNSNAGKFIRLV